MSSSKAGQGGVPIWMCLGLCIVAAVAAHKGGCFVREQYFTNKSNVPEIPPFTSLEANQQFYGATRTRQVAKVSASCLPNVCPTSFREVIIDEMLFPEGFGQIAGEDTGEDDDEEEEEEDDDGDDDDDGESESLLNDPSVFIVKVDLKFVDQKFLRSVEKLQQALLSVVWDESSSRDLQLEGMRCQTSSYITCTATFNHGNFFHLMTDPEEGGSIYLTADIAGKGGDLESLISLLQEHFSVAASTDQIVRSNFRLHALGIFRAPFNPMLMEDLFVFSWMPGFVELYKTIIADETSEFQRITVAERVRAKTRSVDGYEAMMIPGSSSYAATHPELFQPTRVLFLDGTTQSTSHCDASYHEALVHPGMFAHPTGPKRVAIVGGGEGATLREVLKHKSVDKCLMIEIDPDMVRVAREALPQWNDCSDFSEADVNCFDHPRADVRLEDAFAWFRTHFGPSATDRSEEPLDLVIMDALDPEGTAEIAKVLYQNEDFWTNIKEGLTEDGILVMQMGSAPLSHESVGEQFSFWKNRDAFLEVIERVGFRQMFTYVEDHAGFDDPWTFLVACASDRCRDPWFSNTAQVNLEMHRRIHQRRSDKRLTLDFFDGVLASEYQRPSSQWEWVYCKKVPKPAECLLAESNARRAALGGATGMRNAADLKVVAAFARAISATKVLEHITEFRPTASHLSSPVRARHSTLMLAEYLSDAVASD